MTRVIASIEARMTSTRLPGKSVELIGGVPALELVIIRVKRVAEVGGIILATPTDPCNQPLWDIARRHCISVVKGSENDVLARVTSAHKEMGSDICVRVCGDQVFLDPGIVSDAIKAYRAGLGEFITTTRGTGYPVGVDAEVFSFKDLDRLNETLPTEADNYREHVSLYWYEQEDYRVYKLEPRPIWRMPDLRLCLDTKEDLKYLREVADEFGWDCTTEEILEGIRHGRCRKLVERSSSHQIQPTERRKTQLSYGRELLESTGEYGESALRDLEPGESCWESDYNSERNLRGYSPDTRRKSPEKGDRSRSVEVSDESSETEGLDGGDCGIPSEQFKSERE